MMPVYLKFLLSLAAQGQLADIAQGLLDSKDARLDALRLLLRDILRDLVALGVFRREEVGQAQIDLKSLEAFFLGIKGLHPHELYEEYTLGELAAIWRAEQRRNQKQIDIASLAKLMKTEKKETPCAGQADATAVT